jgi:hypothetical protein
MYWESRAVRVRTIGSRTPNKSVVGGTPDFATDETSLCEWIASQGDSPRFDGLPSAVEH